MDLELYSAANFLVHLIRLHAKVKHDPKTLTQFRDNLVYVFRENFVNHWNLKRPYKNSFLRRISITRDKMDPYIIQAGAMCGLTEKYLYKAYPYNITMWIDPYEVSYLFSNSSSIVIIYTYKEHSTTPWRPDLNTKKTVPKKSIKKEPPTNPYFYDIFEPHQRALIDHVFNNL